MTSQENNERNNLNFGESGSSQVKLLTTEFKLRLNSKLDEKIAALEAEKTQLIAADTTWMDEMKVRSAKMKKMKKEIKSVKVEVQNLKQTRDGQRQVAKDMDNYVWLLKQDFQMYREESNAVVKQQNESIEYLENRWKEYQAKYETLPSAVVRTKEKTSLLQAKIEFMMKQQKLIEINQIIAQRHAIKTKRINNLAIKCAELYNESKIEEDKMCTALATRKNLEKILLGQEKTLMELVKKEEQQLAAPQQLAIDKSNTELMMLLASVEEVPLEIPRFDLSTIRQSLIQPMPTFSKDPDTDSITSSFIDNLIEPNDSSPRETDEHDGQDQEQNITPNGSLNANKKSNDVEEGRNLSCATLRFKGMDEEEEEFERFEVTLEKYEEVEKRSWLKASAEEEEEKIMEEEAEVINEKLTDKREYQTLGKEYQRTSSSQVEEFHTTTQGCPSEIKRPKILKTEMVHVKLNPNKPRESPFPISSRENSISRYFTSSTSVGDWKRNYLSSGFSYSENVDVDSVVGSVSSMQSDDFANRFHFQFSPERGDKNKYMKESIDDNKIEYTTPRPTVPGPLQIGAPLKVQGFLDMENVQDTPTSRRNKKDFISLF